MDEKKREERRMRYTLMLSDCIKEFMSGDGDDDDCSLAREITTVAAAEDLAYALGCMVPFMILQKLTGATDVLDFNHKMNRLIMQMAPKEDAPEQKALSGSAEKTK